MKFPAVLEDLEDTARLGVGVHAAAKRHKSLASVVACTQAIPHTIKP